MKTLILSFVLFVGSTMAQPPHSIPMKNHDKLYWSSVVTLTTTQILDIHSSVGKYELNPIAQGRDGGFHTKKGILIKSTFLGTAFAVQWLILRKRPDWKDELSIFNFGVSAVTIPVTIHNYHVPKIH